MSSMGKEKANAQSVVFSLPGEEDCDCLFFIIPFMNKFLYNHEYCAEKYVGSHFTCLTSTECFVLEVFNSSKFSSSCLGRRIFIGITALRSKSVSNEFCYQLFENVAKMNDISKN